MKKVINFNHIFLLLIIIFASFLYFYKITKIPSGIYVDEATVGYNAYSILKTGKDEYGKSFPIAFRFFGAYTPSLYVYLIIPIIKIFGLNTFSVRFLSAVFTIIGILIIYFFIKKLNIYKSPLTNYITTTLFTICPWVVFNARLGYEVTFGYIIFSLGALLLWNSITRNKISILALTILSISTYIAHTERYLVPIFILFISIIFRKNIINQRNKKSLIISSIIIFITQIPNFYLLTTNAFWVKNSVYTNTNLSQIINDFFSQLLTYFSPKAIFGISPDINLQHTIPMISLLYPWLIIPFFMGLYQLYLKRKTSAGKFLIILFFTAPIPGALSGHFISIQRVLTLIVPLFLIISLGIDYLLQKIKLIIFLPLFLILFTFSLLLLWRSYFVFFPQQRAVWWNYGYQQLTEIIKDSPQNNFIIDNTRSGPVYINILFYLKYSPTKFQKQFSSKFIDSYYSNPSYNSNYKFSNIDIRPINWDKDIFTDQILVGDDLSISPDQTKEHFLEKIFDIKDPLGKSVLIGYKTNPEKKILDNKIKLKLNKNIN